MASCATQGTKARSHGSELKLMAESFWAEALTTTVGTNGLIHAAPGQAFKSFKIKLSLQEVVVSWASSGLLNPNTTHLNPQHYQTRGFLKWSRSEGTAASPFWDVTSRVLGLS